MMAIFHTHILCARAHKYVFFIFYESITATQSLLRWRTASPSHSHSQSMEGQLEACENYSQVVSNVRCFAGLQWMNGHIWVEGLAGLVSCSLLRW